MQRCTLAAGSPSISGRTGASCQAPDWPPPACARQRVSVVCLCRGARLLVAAVCPERLGESGDTSIAVIMDVVLWPYKYLKMYRYTRYTCVRTVIAGINFVFRLSTAALLKACLAGCGPSGTTMDYYGLLPATDLWGLTAGKFDHSGFCRGRSVTFVYMEVRSRAGVRLLS